MKDRDNIYKGPDVVEFLGTTGTVKKGTTAVPGVANVTVQLVGHQSNSPIELNYSIAATSTAVSGTDYNITGTMGKVTIPANSSSANIVVTVIPAGIPTGTKTLVLNLQGNSTIPASANYKTYTLSITQ
ncbi:hypothetical protein [Pedobacter boryungensis]|uniref:Calx-beta domain-containing protein n=1 Tax=Pedobacter boryungensis TaxID=869962 RepID=A0ABX2DBV2_9SPHI|nr:hypothetical protein [Pedobacter boryungensis]NQX30908.1 hypothetical protein [Pedobacter boryungensis]